MANVDEVAIDSLGHQALLRLITKFDGPFRTYEGLHEVVRLIAMLVHEGSSGKITRFFEAALAKDSPDPFPAFPISELGSWLHDVASAIVLVSRHNPLKFVGPQPVLGSVV